MPGKTRRQSKQGVHYYSTQVRSVFENGVGSTKEQTVKINGNKGTKSVTFYNAKGRKTKHATKSLTPKERHCILKCRFVPGLFKDCENKCGRT